MDFKQKLQSLEEQKHLLIKQRHNQILKLITKAECIEVDDDLLGGTLLYLKEHKSDPQNEFITQAKKLGARFLPRTKSSHRKVASTKN